MNISRFFGSTNREALRQVRLALGPDALIVSNRRVNGGVEILAADPTSVPQLDAGGLNVGKAVPVPAVATAPVATAPVAAPGSASTTDSLMREFDAMRGALESRIDALLWSNRFKQSTQLPALFQSLLSSGFSTALLRAMLERLPADLSLRAAREWALAELTRHLPVLDDEAALWTPGLTLALVGPTGAGKTTTIAKLAARAVQHHGATQVALLTTDTYRIGAFEQLKIYGDLLGVPVRVVRDAQELAKVMDIIPPRVTVLIDNVGVSQRDGHVAEQVAMLSGVRREIKRLLVLNASSHGDTLDEVARSYSRGGGAPLQGCIITKADEAPSLGAALDTAIRHRLPVHYVSNGQKVPEDLLHLSAQEMVELAVVTYHDVRALYAPSEADMAALMAVARPAQTAAPSVASAQSLLTALLSTGDPGHLPLSANAISDACHEIDDVLPVAEARDIWRSVRAEAQSASASVRPHHDRMLRTVRVVAAAQPDQRMFVIHGAAPFKLDSGRKGALRASLVFDASGAAMVSPVQQLSLPDGWWSSCGASAQRAPTAGDALLQQIKGLHGRRPEPPMLHVFEQGPQRLWRDLAGARIPWLARVSGVSRVLHEGSLTMVSALAAGLNHQPVARISCRTAAGMSLSVACVPVQMPARGLAPVPLQLVSLKIVEAGDGRLIKGLLGLASPDAAARPASELAACLYTAFQVREVFRGAAQLWATTAYSSQPDSHPLLSALLAAQTALASWQLMHQPSRLSELVCQLAGTGEHSVLPTSMGLHKLFMLDHWLSEQGVPGNGMPIAAPA